MTAERSAVPATTDLVELTAAARNQRKSVGRLVRLLRQSVALSWRADRPLFSSTVVLQLSSAVVLVAQVLVVKMVLDAFVAVTERDASLGEVLLPVGLLALITAAASVSTALLSNQQRVLGELITRSSWWQMLDVTGSVDLRTFESPEFFNRLQRVQTNTLSRPFQLTQGVVGLVGAVAGSVGLGVAIVSIEPLLLPLLLLSGVPIFFTTRLQSRAEFAFVVQQTPLMRLREYLGVAQTGREEAKEVRAFRLGPVLRKRFDAAYQAYIQDLRVHVRHRTRLALIGNLASAVFLAGTLVAVVLLVGAGRVGLAEAGAAIVAIRMLATRLTAAFRAGQLVFESGLFLDDLEEFVALKPAAEEHQRGAPAPDSFTELTVENVTFTYPGSTEPALDGVSMRVAAGEVIALVGENGSGKSTLAKLLAGLYDADGGTIRWDGVDIRTYDRASLRRSIAVVFQDFVRYQLSAADNIGLGRAERIGDDARIRHAAAQAGAAGAIEAMPRGYDTVLSKMFKDGKDLSGGQWQRVALARAFFRDAPFVLLDEPSSALDPRAEHELFQSIRELLADRTVLFVSHRFSTARSADRIYVLADGQVREHGSHEELMALNSRYAELFRLQAAAYVSSETLT